jgi:hypothetical protein
MSSGYYLRQIIALHCFLEPSIAWEWTYAWQGFRRWDSHQTNLSFHCPLFYRVLLSCFFLHFGLCFLVQVVSHIVPSLEHVHSAAGLTLKPRALLVSWTGCIAYFCVYAGIRVHDVGVFRNSDYGLSLDRQFEIPKLSSEMCAKCIKGSRLLDHFLAIQTSFSHSHA